MALSPYATATALKRPAPSYVTDPEDIERVGAYGAYEDIWNNVPEAFAELLRAEDDPLARRYVPVVREILEATNRYLAQDVETTWTPVPGNPEPSPDAMLEWRSRLDAFWVREEVAIKFMSSKRWLLIKGDGLLHLSADLSKAEGSRVRLTEIPPEQFFPIWDPRDGERIIGCYLVSVVLNDDDEEIVQRIEYRKSATEEDVAAFGTPIGQVFYRLGFFEQDGWDGRNLEESELKPVEAPAWSVSTVPGAPDPIVGFALDARITTLPVYRMRNRRRGGIAGRFGTSEIQGLESVFAGVIQNTTDEDLAVALTGLGVYFTDSGKSRDAQGNEIDWEIGPASVAELEKDAKFGRVPGITSVQPIQDHVKALIASARGANAAPEIASGRTESSAQISGVALRIQFMPTLAANMEREAELSSVWTHLLYDLMTMWFPVYEGWQPLPLQPGIVFGDPLPQDRVAVVTEVTQLVAAGIMSKEFAAEYLAETLGYKFPADMVESAAAEQQATLDAEGARIAAAAGQVPGGGEEG
jgi:hypothetical protein